MMMNDFRFYHKDFLLGFLDIYKNMPSLWQVKHPEYHNKAKKEKDFEILIRKMKEIEPRADRNSVANKISNLRSVYKRECKRLSKLQPNKKHDELVSETVWYFEYLHFLQDIKPRGTITAAKTATKSTTVTATPVTSTSESPEDQNQQSTEATIVTNKRKNAETAANAHDDSCCGADDGGEPQAKAAKLESSNTNDGSAESAVKMEDKDRNDVSEIVFPQENAILLPDLVLKTEPEEATAVDAENDERDSNEDLLSEIGCSTFNSDHANSDHVERNQNFDFMERNNYDRFDHMTSAWAGILRNLPRSQQIFAEKLINDVLFEAQLDNLSRKCVLLAPETQKNKQNG